MWFGLITLFPTFFSALDHGITGRAIKNHQLMLDFENPRTHAPDKHQTVDDRPFGGGPGMLMKMEPLSHALAELKRRAPSTPHTIYLSPQGHRFDQSAAAALAQKKSIILISGRYEGIDERFLTQAVDEEWSIGDYILTGGELASMVMIDAITRLLPGVLGAEESISQDSLTSGLLKHPQYTRPPSLNGENVPDVLLSGHHQQIEAWRLKQSLGKTWLKRPDLLSQKPLSRAELTLLNEFISEFIQKNPRKKL